VIQEGILPRGHELPAPHGRFDVGSRALLSTPGCDVDDGAIGMTTSEFRRRLVAGRRRLRRFRRLRRRYYAAQILLKRVRDLAYIVPSPRLGGTQDEADVTVALTSFPARISYVARTIESLQRQSVRPARIVICLARGQFIRQLPISLRLQLRRPNVLLLWVEEDTRSFKKLVPVRRRFPEEVIVTVDDDVIYHRRFLQHLLDVAGDHPGAIVGTRGWELSVEDGRLAPYLAARPANARSVQDRVLLTGIGGILYPPRALAPSLLGDPLAHGICPTADDIWFWAVARVTGTSTVCAPPPEPLFREIAALYGTVGLNRVNNDEGANDIQLRRVIRHFELHERLGIESDV
jgi:hypothetical protein